MHTRSLHDIEKQLEELIAAPCAGFDAGDLLRMSEEVLEHWVQAHRQTPTQEKREGFRLLALHRQGAKDDPSFNACRETCRELVYHYNLITMEPDHPETQKRQRLMIMVANHLFLFVGGKLQVQELGDFCCASKPIRQSMDSRPTGTETTLESS